MCGGPILATRYPRGPFDTFVALANGTREGDGLTARKCLDYGEYHHLWWYDLTIGNTITLGVFANWRRPTFVFYLWATAERMDDATVTLIRIATAAGLTLVAKRGA